jgi:hypothetical protein
MYSRQNFLRFTFRAMLFPSLPASAIANVIFALPLSLVGFPTYRELSTQHSV